MREGWGLRGLDIAQKKGRTIIIYGEAGRGKTSLLNTLKGRVLLINLDCGEQVLREREGLEFDIFPLVTKKEQSPTDSIKKFEWMVNKLLNEDELGWDYIVLDNITEIQEIYNESFQKIRGIKFPRQLEYRDTGIEMKRNLRQLRNLTYKGVNVIYIAWEDTNKIEDMEGKFIVRRHL